MGANSKLLSFILICGALLLSDFTNRGTVVFQAVSVRIPADTIPSYDNSCNKFKGVPRRAKKIPPPPPPQPNIPVHFSPPPPRQPPPQPSY